MACRMASKSWGVAPSEFNALTTSDSRAPAGSWMRLPGSWRMEMSAFSATVVWPPDNALGWLMIGVELARYCKTPYAYGERMGFKACLAAREKGVLLRPLGNVIVVMPPLSLTATEAKLIVDALMYAIPRVTETA